jgi:hypothetical protein
MSNLLNFNTNRELGFPPNRDLVFDPNRDLTFDLNRVLSFDPNRDLGFGKRGVLFRGYVCAACGAIVSVDATSCDECGAVFEAPEEKGIMKAPPPAFRPTAESRAAPPPAPSPWAPPPPPPSFSRPEPPSLAEQRPPPPPFAGTPPPTPSTARFCPTCGARSWHGDAFCWNCGTRFTGAAKPGTAPPAAFGPSPPPTEAIQLPAHKAKKVVKDWTETGKTLSEYAEEEK